MRLFFLNILIGVPGWGKQAGAINENIIELDF
jgi:hypothetical protein